MCATGQDRTDDLKRARLAPQQEDQRFNGYGLQIQAVRVARKYARASAYRLSLGGGSAAPPPCNQRPLPHGGFALKPRGASSTGGRLAPQPGVAPCGPVSRTSEGTDSQKHAFRPRTLRRSAGVAPTPFWRCSTHIRSGVAPPFLKLLRASLKLRHSYWK